MSWGFQIGQKYNRRADIHARFGGQPQGGIITPSKHNVIFIISGKAGQNFGYDDRIHDDGSVDYFGEGQTGDMKLIRGNRSVANHGKDGKSLLFFEKHYPERQLEFRGEMVCEGYSFEQSVDGDGRARQAIVFRLVPLELVSAVVEEMVVPSDGLDIAALRARAIAAAAPSKAMEASVRTVFERSADVRNYVLARAGGKCEGCKALAPFCRKDGSAYLESHHTTRVSDGGLDDPRHVIALCPNCHACVHRGMDGEAYNDTLIHELKQIEAH